MDVHGSVHCHYINLYIALSAHMLQGSTTTLDFPCTQISSIQFRGSGLSSCNLDEPFVGGGYPGLYPIFRCLNTGLQELPLIFLWSHCN